jgi:hypothetical protein
MRLLRHRRPLHGAIIRAAVSSPITAITAISPVVNRRSLGASPSPFPSRGPRPNDEKGTPIPGGGIGVRTCAIEGDYSAPRSTPTTDCWRDGVLANYPRLPVAGVLPEPNLFDRKDAVVRFRQRLRGQGRVDVLPFDDIEPLHHSRGLLPRKAPFPFDVALLDLHPDGRARMLALIAQPIIANRHALLVFGKGRVVVVACSHSNTIRPSPGSRMDVC